MAHPAKQTFTSLPLAPASVSIQPDFADDKSLAFATRILINNGISRYLNCRSSEVWID